MSERFSESDSRKLAHAYVALALAQDVANGYISSEPSHAILHPLVTMLDLTARLLEEVLENNLQEEASAKQVVDDSPTEDPMWSMCSEMVM